MAMNILDIDDNIKVENPRPYLLAAKYVGLISFALGTLILLAYLISLHTYIIYVGLMYTMAAFAVNSIVFLFLLWALYKQKNNRKILAKRIALFLLNIPISIAYFFIVIYCIDNVAKITFINDTTENISHVELSIGSKNIILLANELKQGASTTSYIFRPSDEMYINLNKMHYRNANNEIIELNTRSMPYGSRRQISLAELIEWNTVDNEVEEVSQDYEPID